MRSAQAVHTQCPMRTAFLPTAVCSWYTYCIGIEKLHVKNNVSAHTLAAGTIAPDFSHCPDKAGNAVRLNDFRGKNVSAIFYPKDDTRGCTAQACAFRDSYEVFKDAGAEVIGISADSATSHQGFAARYQLPFSSLE